VRSPGSETIRRVKAQPVCPKCGKPLVAAITRVTDEQGKEQRRVHYHCQDRSCDGEVENPAEFRAFARPAPQPTALSRWLATHRGRRWTPPVHRTPALGGGFAMIAPRGRR